MCKPTEIKAVFKSVESSLYKTGRWTDEEHEVFVKAMRQYGKNWKEVSRVMRTRSPVQVRTHAQKFFLKAVRADLNDGKQVPIEFTSLKKDTAILSTCLEVNKTAEEEVVHQTNKARELGLEEGVEEERRPIAMDAFQYMRDLMGSDSSSSSLSSEDEGVSSDDETLSQAARFVYEEKEENFDYNDLFMDEFENFTCKSSSCSTDEEKDDLSVSSILNDTVVGLAEDEKDYRFSNSHAKRSADFDAQIYSNNQDVKKIRVDYPQVEDQEQTRSKNFDELSFADFDDNTYGFSMDGLNREESFLAGFEDLLY